MHSPPAPAFAPFAAVATKAVEALHKDVHHPLRGHENTMAARMRGVDPPRPAAPERGGTGDPLPRAAEPCGEDWCDGQLHYDVDPQQVRPRPKRTWVCPKRPA